MQIERQVLNDICTKPEHNKTAPPAEELFSLKDSVKRSLSFADGERQFGVLH